MYNLMVIGRDKVIIYPYDYYPSNSEIDKVKSKYSSDHTVVAYPNNHMRIMDKLNIKPVDVIFKSTL